MMLPTIENPLVLQSGKATLAEVFYCHGRQYQTLVRSSEAVVLKHLELRWKSLEFPLLFLAFWMHPAYKTFAKKMMRPDSFLSLLKVVDWCDKYVSRLFGPRSPSVVTAAHSWNSATDDWANKADEFSTRPGYY